MLQLIFDLLKNFQLSGNVCMHSCTRIHPHIPKTKSPIKTYLHFRKSYTLRTFIQYLHLNLQKKSPKLKYTQIESLNIQKGVSRQSVDERVSLINILQRCVTNAIKVMSPNDLITHLYASPPRHFAPADCNTCSSWLAKGVHTIQMNFSFLPSGAQLSASR